MVRKHRAGSSPALGTRIIVETMQRWFPFLLFPVVISAGLLLGGSCLPQTTYSAEGDIVGRKISTVVDSKLAQLLIANPSDSLVVRLSDLFKDRTINNELLTEITERYSPDVATLFFLKQTYQHKKNKTSQDYYNYAVEKLIHDSTISEIERLKDHLIVFVPGLAYKEDTTTGADFARQRRLLDSLGVNHHLIETEEWGLSDTNAAIITSELRRICKIHSKIIIVSASKGGLETAIALGKLLSPEETIPIKAWVSVGGILRGSPIADQYLCWPNCWFAQAMLWMKGKGISLVEDISHSKRSAEFQSLVFPQNVRVIHFVGAPLSTQISSEIESRYCSLISTKGPNDGLTTLPDEVTEDGIIISEIGLDHYFRDPNIDVKTIALACAAIANTD